MLVGVTRGLQMMADYLKLAFKVLPVNPDAWPDFKVVADIWLAETTNTAGVVKVSAWGLLWGGDPWKGSRAAWQTLKAKWGTVQP